MTFKKDYINYVLHTVVNNTTENFYNDKRLRKIIEKISSVDDMVKMTYMVGKTAGLEFLFKYLLYISDKIDKSQITIFNLKDNYDYDIKNLTKICQAIQNYKSSRRIEYIPEKEADTIKEINENDTVKVKEDIKDTIRIKIAEEKTADKSKDKSTGKSKEKQEDKPSNLINIEDADVTSESGESNLTLIENPESYSGEAEVFELSNMDTSGDEEQTTEDVKEDENTEDENETGSEDDQEAAEDDIFGLNELEEEMQDKIQTTDDITLNRKESDDIVTDEGMEKIRQDFGIKETELKKGNEGTKELADEEDEAEKTNESESEIEEIEILVNKKNSDEEYSEEGSPVTEGSVQNDAYYKFETKFFEEVKILEKLFSRIGNDCVGEEGMLSEKCLQSLSEIIEITSELSSLSRQLSFDLIADIFLTMNLYFTKTISAPSMLTGDRINLLDSALALVNSLIKGEDYLNYDTIVDRIENLKKEVTRPSEEHDEIKEEIASEMKSEADEEQPAREKPVEEEYIENEESAEYEYIESSEQSKNAESSNFKMKYLIKEFEKSFQSIGELKGEYSRFDALEKVDDLNNALRLIAKISASVKMKDVLKLAEVAYVFLKYVKDYRMDLTDPEIQQIVKYIIFTFKMLLTNRKPEDFNVLVQHLNNPVKIFTDN